MRAGGLRRAGIGAAALACLVVPSAASADSIQIGSKLDKPWGGNANFACGGNCAALQFSQAGESAPLGLVAPNAATITSWSVRTTPGGGVLFTLRVLRRTGGPDNAPQYSFHGSAPAPSPTPMVMDTILTYPASLPIAAGEGIGFASSNDFFPYAMTNGDSSTILDPAPADGAGPSGADIPTPNFEMLLQATLTYCKVPTLTGQTEATARAALTTADCAAGAITKQRLQLQALKKAKKGASKKKRKQIKAQNAAIEAENARLRAQNGIVLAQGTAPGTIHGAVPGPGVPLTVGEAVEPPAPKKKKKKKRKK